MVQKGRPAGEQPTPPPAPKPRVSVSFEPADYDELVRIAAEKRVSLAWVVRDAVAAYIFRRGPLFRQPPHTRPAPRPPE